MRKRQSANMQVDLVSIRRYLLSVGPVRILQWRSSPSVDEKKKTASGYRGDLELEDC